MTCTIQTLILNRCLSKFHVTSERRLWEARKYLLVVVKILTSLSLLAELRAAA
jgi:hypothetical protein